MLWIIVLFFGLAALWFFYRFCVDRGIQKVLSILRAEGGGVFIHDVNGELWRYEAKPIPRDTVNTEAKKDPFDPKDFEPLPTVETYHWSDEGGHWCTGMSEAAFAHQYAPQKRDFLWYEEGGCECLRCDNEGRVIHGEADIPLVYLVKNGRGGYDVVSTGRARTFFRPVCTVCDKHLNANGVRIIQVVRRKERQTA